MRVARILKRSTKRLRSGSVRGGKGYWQIALLLVFGIVGTVSLVASVSRMTKIKVKNNRSLLRFTLYMVVLTIFMCIPAVVLLALNPTLAVGIICIVTLCFLVLPLLIWIPLAVKMSRDLSHDGDLEVEETESKPTDAERGPEEEVEQRAINQTDAESKEVRV